jgi:hypothetical protein
MRHARSQLGLVALSMVYSWVSLQNTCNAWRITHSNVNQGTQGLAPPNTITNNMEKNSDVPLRWSSVSPLPWSTAFGKIQRRAPFLNVHASLDMVGEFSREEDPGASSSISSRTKSGNAYHRDTFEPPLQAGVRQLLLDNDAIHRVHGNVVRKFHQAAVIGGFNVSVSDEIIGYPWIDGVIRDAATGVIRMWHACTDDTSCISFSFDGGLHWSNTTSTKLNGPLIHRERGAVYQLSENEYVAAWFMYPQQLEIPMAHRNEPGKRKLVLRPLGKLLSFVSSDGFTWSPTGHASSDVGDASSTFYDPFRERYFVAFKMNFLSLIRSQFLWAVKDLRKYPVWEDVYSTCVARANFGTKDPVPTWRRCLRDGDARAQLHPLPLIDAGDVEYGRELVDRMRNSGRWTAADEDAEQLQPDERPGTRITDAYTFSAFGYESHLIGVVCVQSWGLANRPKRIEPHLSFSRGQGTNQRDTYPVFSRTPVDQRLPLLNYARDSHYDLASVGMLQTNAATLIYVASTAYSYEDDSDDWRWPRYTPILVSRLRRDGFASLRLVDTDGEARRQMNVKIDGSAREPKNDSRAVVETKWMSVVTRGKGVPDSPTGPMGTLRGPAASRRLALMVNVDGCSAEAILYVTISSSVDGTVHEESTIEVESSGTAVNTGLTVPVQGVFFVRFSWSSHTVDLYSFWVE